MCLFVFLTMRHSTLPYLLVGSVFLRCRDFSKDSVINAEHEFWATGQHNLGFCTELQDTSSVLIGVKTVYYVLILLSHMEMELVKTTWI